MKVEKINDQWVVTLPGEGHFGPFSTNAAAWAWVDRLPGQGGEEGDHAGRQDWSIKQHLQAE